MSQSNQTIMITGATGFVGTHLLSALSKHDFELIIAGRDRPQSSTHVSSFVSIGHIDGQTDWSQALENVNTVIHLAARAHKIHDTAVDPEQAFQAVNTQGTINLVRQSIMAGVQHFIFMSSIGAMATTCPTPLTEESPCCPDTSYGRSKLDAEQALITMAKNSPMRWTILRPALVYGPRNPGNMERLIKLIETGLPIPLGAIQNRRSFIYVGNLVDIIQQVLHHKNATNEVFLCSDAQDLSTPDLIRKMAQTAQHPCKLIPIPLPLLKSCTRMGDRLQQLFGNDANLTATLEKMTGSLAIDAQKLQTKLNWTPPYTVDAGLQDLFQWRNSSAKEPS